MALRLIQQFRRLNTLSTRVEMPRCEKRSWHAFLDSLKTFWPRGRCPTHGKVSRGRDSARAREQRCIAAKLCGITYQFAEEEYSPLAKCSLTQRAKPAHAACIHGAKAK